MSTKLENLFEEFLETPEKKKLTTVPRTTKILREGEAIIIPEPISYRAASKALGIMADQDEEEIERVETYTCHPNDGYVAVTRAIEDSFGFATAKAIDMGFFGKQKPQTKRIKTGLGAQQLITALSLAYKRAQAYAYFSFTQDQEISYVNYSTSIVNYSTSMRKTWISLLAFYSY